MFETLGPVEEISKWWTWDTIGDNHKGGKIYFRFQKKLDKMSKTIWEYLPGDRMATIEKFRPKNS